jgi:hypothetical protein
METVNGWLAGKKAGAGPIGNPGSPPICAKVVKPFGKPALFPAEFGIIRCSTTGDGRFNYEIT